eukprot:1192556-Prorocentrum_minimum.AAC.1
MCNSFGVLQVLIPPCMPTGANKCKQSANRASPGVDSRPDMWQSVGREFRMSTIINMFNRNVDYSAEYSKCCALNGILVSTVDDCRLAQRECKESEKRAQTECKLSAQRCKASANRCECGAKLAENGRGNGRVVRVIRETDARPAAPTSGTLLDCCPSSKHSL